MDPEYRLQEQPVHTVCWRLAREQWENKVLQQRAVYSKRTYDMATKLNISSGKLIFHQPCELWNDDCWVWVHSFIQFIKRDKEKKLCRWSSVICLSQIWQRIDDEYCTAWIARVHEKSYIQVINFQRIAYHIIIYLPWPPQRYATIVTLLVLLIEVQVMHAAVVVCLASGWGWFAPPSWL